MEEAILMEISSKAGERFHHIFLFLRSALVNLCHRVAIVGQEADKIADGAEESFPITHKRHILRALKTTLSQQHGTQISLLPLGGFVEHLLETTGGGRRSEFLHTKRQVAHRDFLDDIASTVNLFAFVLEVRFKIHQVVPKELVFGIENDFHR